MFLIFATLVAALFGFFAASVMGWWALALTLPIGVVLGCMGVKADER